MPKKKKKAQSEDEGTRVPWSPSLETDETLGSDQLIPTDTGEKPAIEEEATAKKPTDMVKVKVLAGTLGWSGGYYEKGEIFTISREDLKRFGSQYYQIIK